MSTINNISLHYLYQNGYLTEIDLHFSAFIAGLADSTDPAVRLAAALVSNATGNGNICLDLSNMAAALLAARVAETPAVRCPDLEQWETALHSHPAVGSPGDRRPLILDTKHRLYLYRYWEYESKLAALIQDRIRREVAEADIDTDLLTDGLQRLFPQRTDRQIDWQKVAGLASVLNRFCVITGGPGTGKTFTVARILALLLEQAGGHLKIALTAPTGKAAAKLGETLKKNRDGLDCRQNIKNAVPVEAGTIHRLLGPVSDSPYFRYNAANRLPADLVIVDEASMVDLALMSKLVQALEDHTRLVLIGDRDQLASVEAGAVLGDICGRDRRHIYSTHFSTRVKRLAGESIVQGSGKQNGGPGLHDSVINLVRNYRFGNTGGIGELGRAINEGDSERALVVLKDGTEAALRWRPVISINELHQGLSDSIVRGYGAYLRVGDPGRALALFSRFRLLCAVKKGPFGVVEMNRFAEQVLRQHRLITAENDDGRWYAGRPVMITRNDYDLGLFNGDTGIAMLDSEFGASRLMVYFPDVDRMFRKVPIYRLPDCETVFAATVHKSQGSEYEAVHLILPGADAPVLSRELIYTAVTRARQTVTVWGDGRILASAVSRKIERTSGLRDALWPELPDEGAS